LTSARRPVNVSAPAAIVRTAMDAEASHGYGSEDVQRVRALIRATEQHLQQARKRRIDEFHQRSTGALAEETTVADCLTYIHYAEAYNIVAQGFLASGDLELCDTILGVAFMWLDFAQACLDKLS
jgi:hypothetical protein